MRIRLGQCVFILAAVLLIFSCGGGGGGGGVGLPPAQEKPGVLSISAMPRLNPLPVTADDYFAVFTEAFNLAYNAGARGQVSTFTWRELEPDAGAYSAQKFSDLQNAIANAQNHSMTQFIGLQIINTTSREMPADLASLAFSDPAVINRFHALLDRVLTAENRSRIRYLSIGNEVDAYLNAHPAEWAAYKAFYDDSVAYAHALDPSVAVGVTATADGALIHSPGWLQNLNASSDVIILTYYPMAMSALAVFTARDPGEVAADFTAMMAFSGSRPLILQEVGYPASAVNASSEAKQSQFVSAVFAAWRNSEGRIPFLNFFLLHDFTGQMCEDFGVYYGLPGNDSFETFLCSMGLRLDDGTPRTAWGTLTTEAARSGLP